MVTVTCCELAPVIGDLPGNVTRAREAIAGAVASGADVVVLPELMTSGYVFESMDEARACAVAAHDPLFDVWREAAGAAVVVAGFAERGDGEVVHNSAILLQAGG